MEAKIAVIDQGTVTSPKGFHAGATYVGIKKKPEGSLDLGLLFSDTPSTVAGVFTTNKIKAAPVILCQNRLESGRAVAVVANSGCANAGTGEQGLADAIEMADLAAQVIGVSPEDVLVVSTGVIGKKLPIELIRGGMGQIILSADGGHELEKAIMTTDTIPKEVAVSVDGDYVIGGIAKGSGMVHPQMATLLCFLTTDVTVQKDFLKSALRQAVDVSFNMVSIDGDTSTNDTVLILANGRAGSKVSEYSREQADTFQRALNWVCVHLAKMIARDGEGANKLIEASVTGAVSVAEARLAARTIVSSSLVKSAIHGNDPNWGRIIAAVGRSGIQVEEEKLDLHLGDAAVLHDGNPLPYDEKDIVEVFGGSEVKINLNLNLGSSMATAWGCDLSEEYVAINSAYMT